LINDSEQDPLLKTPAAVVFMSDVISYSNSRAIFYRKLVQRKGAVPWRVFAYRSFDQSLMIRCFTRQFCSNVPCSGSRVNELADRQSQTTLNIILQADLTRTILWLAIC